MGELQIPVALFLVANHCQHLGHVLVSAPDTTVVTGVEGAHGNVVYSLQGVHCLRQALHELATAIRKRRDMAASLRYVLVNKDIGRVLRGKFCGGDGIIRHVGAAVETVGEMEGI